MPNKSEIAARMIELDGVPQVPDAFVTLLQRPQCGGHVEPEPTGDLLDECQESIDAACREIQRRHLKRMRRAPAPPASEETSL